MIKKILVLCALSLLAACESPQAQQGIASCDALKNLKISEGEVVAAERESGGNTFLFKGLFIGVPFFELPPSCRVQLVLKPSSDSYIQSEVWLPESGWNEKLAGVGNGGFAGSVDDLSLTVSLQRGYAATATDTGHVANDKDGRWAIGHPEKRIDYAYRAIHLTAVAAKQVIAAYYGKPAKYAYFNSGPNGGRQALISAQRYPEDYDGIMAGCPASYPSSTLSTWAWTQQQLLNTPGAYIPDEKLEAIATAVNQSCDAQDGVADGVIDDPRRCNFKPESLLCAGEDRDDCLTAPQVRSLSAIYAGPPGQLEGSPFRGFEPGGERGAMGWVDWFMGSAPKKSNQYIYVPQFFGNFVFDSPDWKTEQFDIARDPAEFRRVAGPLLDAVEPDLSRFKARGGKLIMYHGWNDPALPPRTTIDYYERIRATMGESEASGFVQLYMVPGVQHCFAGPGTHSFGQGLAGGNADPRRNISSALEVWVEKGVAPKEIIAGKYKEELKSLFAPEKSTLLRTRPICPYPQVARWSGQGSTDDAANFSCVMPQP